MPANIFVAVFDALTDPGLKVDRDTGFPAIAVFPSQRTHLGRGDACVTFETEEGAQEAVEELNCTFLQQFL